MLHNRPGLVGIDMPDYISRRQAPVPVRALPHHLRPQDGPPAPRPEAPHQREAHELQALRQDLPRQVRESTHRTVPTYLIPGTTKYG